MKLSSIKKMSLEHLKEKSENEIQNKIIDYCRKNDILVIVVPNELARLNKSVKIEKGCSDLIIVLNFQTIFVEIKKYCGIQSEYQMKFQSKIESRNQKYFICKSLEEFVDLVKKLQFPEKKN